MARAAVTAQALSNSSRLCQRSIQSLSKASQTLQQRYAAAGADWDDSKYAQLGVIIAECRSALGRPVSQLNDCVTTLQQLMSRVSEYEEVNL